VRQRNAGLGNHSDLKRVSKGNNLRRATRPRCQPANVLPINVVRKDAVPGRVRRVGFVPEVMTRRAWVVHEKRSPLAGLGFSQDRLGGKQRLRLTSFPFCAVTDFAPRFVDPWYFLRGFSHKTPSLATQASRVHCLRWGVMEGRIYLSQMN